jgi:organic hydroperoxide reductase OsmC/OhrA
MPAKAGTGWSVSWSSHTEHRDEFADEEELRASEHVGCYGSAIAHSLAQAGASPTRLKVSVEAEPTPETEKSVLVVHVRAQIPGVDQAVLESVARRVEPTCPVWRALAAEVSMRVVPILEEPQPAQPAAPPAPSAAPLAQTPPAMLASPTARASLAMGRPTWLTPKMGIALLGLLVLAARVAPMLGS